MFTFVDCYAQVQGKVVPAEVHEAASMKTAEAGASVADFYRRHHGARDTLLRKPL
jgi:hypothetical protein